MYVVLRFKTWPAVAGWGGTAGTRAHRWTQVWSMDRQSGTKRPQTKHQVSHETRDGSTIQDTVRSSFFSRVRSMNITRLPQVSESLSLSFRSHQDQASLLCFQGSAISTVMQAPNNAPAAADALVAVGAPVPAQPAGHADRDTHKMQYCGCWSHLNFQPEL